MYRHHRYALRRADMLCKHDIISTSITCKALLAVTFFPFFSKPPAYWQTARLYFQKRYGKMALSPCSIGECGVQIPLHSCGNIYYSIFSRNSYRITYGHSNTTSGTCGMSCREKINIGKFFIVIKLSHPRIMPVDIIHSFPFCGLLCQLEHFHYLLLCHIASSDTCEMIDNRYRHPIKSERTSL